VIGRALKAQNRFLQHHHELYCEVPYVSFKYGWMHDLELPEPLRHRIPQMSQGIEL